MRYFQPDEFACKHCGQNRMVPAFLAKLDELRHRCGFPLVVSSGYRCPAHNQAVSSTGPNGPHTTGQAVDLAVSHERAYIVLRVAIAMGFSGIGIHQRGPGRFIHLDTLTERRPTVWSY